MSSPCPPVVPFLAGVFRREEEAGHSVRPRRRTVSGCPPSPLVAIFSVLSSSSAFIAFSLSFCTPLVLLLALPSCCRGVLLALSDHGLSFFRRLGVCVVCSFPHLFVLLWSCCCRALYAAFRGRGWGCGRTLPPQQHWYNYLYCLC